MTDIDVEKLVEGRLPIEMARDYAQAIKQIGLEGMEREVNDDDDQKLFVAERGMQAWSLLSIAESLDQIALAFTESPLQVQATVYGDHDRSHR